MAGGRGRRVVVLACGQPERGDDGVAFAAADRLDEWLVGRRDVRRDERLVGRVDGGTVRGTDGRVDVRRCGALEPEHLVEIDDEAACVVADCVVGLPAGEVIVLPLAALLDTGVGRRGIDSAASAASAGGGRAAGGGTTAGGGRAAGGEAAIDRPSAAAVRTRPSPRSTHVLPVADVVALARVVRPGLPAGSFVGIGGERFGLGDGLSPAVEAALPAFVEAIEAAVDRLAEPGPDG